MGNHKKVASGIQLIVLYAVAGEGRFSIPLDMRIMRPDPEGSGRRSKDQPQLVLEMVRNLKTRFSARGVDTKGWFIVMDSWYASKDLQEEVSRDGFFVITEGKRFAGRPYRG